MIELDFDPIIGNPYSGINLSDLAQCFDLELIGLNAEVHYLGKLDFQHPQRKDMLTYLLEYKFLREFHAAFAIIPEMMKKWDLPSDRSYLVTKGNPEDVFTAIHMYFVENKLYYQVDNKIGNDCEVSAISSIYPNVSIGRNCVIHDYVVIYPNTIIGDNVIIGPNSVIGGDGLEIKMVNGRSQILPHIGGTMLCDNVEVSAACTINRSLRHTFTYLGPNTKVGNQANIAHGASLGKACWVRAHSHVGNSHVGEGVLVGAGAFIQEQLTVGDHAIIGAMALVNEPVLACSVVYGIPAKHHRWNETIKKEAING